MGGLEFNKIFAAVLVAGIIAGLAGFVAKIMVHSEKLEQDAYTIEAAEDGAGGATAAAAMAEPILAMIASADAARGEKVAKACAACHTFNKGGANGVGPNLYNVVGGPKDHAAGFAYSGALLETGGATWTYAELNKFLWKPKKYAASTKMNFVGLKKPEDRAAVIAWLRTLSDSPKGMPGAGEIAAEEAELAPKVEEAPAAEGEGVKAEDAAAASAKEEAAPAKAEAPASP